MSDINIRLDFDRECLSCDGRGGHGWPRDGSKYVTMCVVCDGKGYVLTDLGESLLQFINRWIEKETD